MKDTVAQNIRRDLVASKEKGVDVAAQFPWQAQHRAGSGHVVTVVPTLDIGSESYLLQIGTRSRSLEHDQSCNEAFDAP